VEWAGEAKALNAQATQVVRALRQYVLDAFGQNSPTLADFGFTPPKKVTLTPEQKAARTAKAFATQRRQRLYASALFAVRRQVTGALVVDHGFSALAPKYATRVTSAANASSVVERYAREAEQASTYATTCAPHGCSLARFSSLAPCSTAPTTLRAAAQEGDGASRAGARSHR
jgi:hypothetical protein